MKNTALKWVDIPNFTFKYTSLKWVNTAKSIPKHSWDTFEISVQQTNMNDTATSPIQIDRIVTVALNSSLDSFITCFLRCLLHCCDQWCAYILAWRTIHHVQKMKGLRWHSTYGLYSIQSFAKVNRYKINWYLILDLCFYLLYIITQTMTFSKRQLF